ncbi:MAG: hypothetical protein K9G33_11185 [Sneathiella sp.]|nr:hypothetical protein [Sneathiella sp.]
MSSAPHINTKMAPSVRTGGAKKAKRLYLRAANDNKAPLIHRIKKLSVIVLPAAMLIFFAAVWFFNAN